MVYGFAQQSGGHVNIDSELGRGTTVKLYLPRALEAPPRAEMRQGEIPRGVGEVILVIEDDLDLKDLLANQLQNLNYRVIGASNAAEARAALTQEPRVDLVLSDVVLPGGANGPKFAEEALGLHRDLKVIFMSGYPAESAKRAGELVSGGILLNKPFEMENLAKVLRQALTSLNGFGVDENWAIARPPTKMAGPSLISFTKLRHMFLPSGTCALWSGR